MATYLRGVTDYVPHIQPFRPDLNFYQKALESKEAQYKSGYDKISNLYGMMLNSEMTREPDIEKRDKFFNQIQNDIQRLSTVDLSLSENVNTAYKIFQPIIDDTNITHDIAWTKTYRNEKSKGEYFRNCIDEKKCGGKWWDKGDQYLEVLRQDYAKADDNNALKMNVPRYVPFVNAREKAMELIKDLAPDVQTISHDGQWIYKDKNGRPLEGHLYNYLTGILGEDGQIADVYNVEAVLARKNYSVQNAATHGGDEDAAEMEYLDAMSAKLFKRSSAQDAKIQKTKSNLITAKNAITQDIKLNGISMPADKGKLEALTSATNELSLTDLFETQNKKVTNSVSGDIAKIDLEAKRKRVDYAVAHGLLSKDMTETAIVYANTHSSREIQANPYGMQQAAFALDIQKMAIKQDYDLQKIKLTNELKNGAVSNDPRYDRSVPVVNDTSVHNKATEGAGVMDLGRDALLSTSSDVKGSQADYLKLTYDQLSLIIADPNDKNDARKQYAKAAINNVFAGMLDKNGQLKEDFEGSPAAEKAFKKAVSLIENNLGGTLIDNQKIRNRFTDKYGAIDAATKRLRYHDEGVRYNNAKVLGHMKTIGKDNKYIADADLLLKPDGHARTYNEFANEILKTRAKQFSTQEDFADYAEDSWEALSEDFAKTYNSNAPGLKLRNVNLSGYKTLDGGAITNLSLSWLVSGDMSTKPTYANTLSTIPDIKNAVSVLSGSDHSKDEITTSDAKAAKFLNFSMDELQSLRYKSRKMPSPEIEVIFNGVAADNKDMMSYTYRYKPTYLDKLTKWGTKNGKAVPNGIAAFMWDADNEEWNNEITAYVKREDANSLAAQGVKKPVSLWDIEFDKGPVSLSEDLGGWLSVEKKDNNYTGDGYMWAYNGEGKLIKIPPTNEIQAIIGGTDADIMMLQLKVILKKAAFENAQVKYMLDEQSRGSAEDFIKKHPQFAEFFK